MQLTISICEVFAAAILAAGVVLGQELPPEAARRTFTPSEIAPPASTAVDVAPSEFVPLRPRKDDPAASETEGLGIGGPGVNGPVVNGPVVNGPDVNGSGVNGSGVNGSGVNGSGVNGSGVNGSGTGGPRTDGPGMDGPGMDGPGMDGPGMDGPGMGGMGMGGMGMGGMGMGGPGYGATWYPSRPVSGSASGADLGLVQQNVSAGVPLWRNGGDSLMLMASVRNSLFFTSAILPDSHQPFPSDLWNVTLGTNYMHKFDNGWSGMLGINFGSASDKPFHSINEMNAGFMSSLQIPVRDDRDAWRFSLMYSPVGNLNFPIPGVAYIWNPSDALRISIGLPPAVVWRPVKDLTISLSYMPLTTVNARATYRAVDKLFIFCGFESSQEAYLLADREVIADRFMGFEERLLGGVRWDVRKHAALEMNAGYAFDRHYGMGQNQIGNLHDQVDIAPGAFISTNFRVRF